MSALSKHHEKIIYDIMKKYSLVEKVILYGSRAKGTFNDRSDVDLAICGESIDRFLLSKIFMDFDESDLPYRVDLLIYQKIKNSKLKEHIDRIGKILYSRN